MARTGADRSRRKRRTVQAEALESLDLDFSTAPTTWKFLNDDSFFRGLMGPVGSGKSYACAAEVMLRAIKQPPAKRDNIRHTRFAIIRNSYPELRSTTIKTWQELFPEGQWGQMRWSPPLTHHIRLPARDDVPGLDCEVLFLALDKPQDVRKLLSLELTGAWVNECRELPLAVIQGLTHRVGRYPSKRDGGAHWRGIWADTNPPDSDHWWHRLAEDEPVRGKYKWTFFKQPPGMIETHAEDTDAAFGANRYWKPNEAAENVTNLPIGYYEQQLGGKALEWIQCYVGAQYVFVSDGKAVWPEFSDMTMCVESLEIDHSLPITIGLDFGLTPAACFGQRSPNGVWNILYELVTDDMGLERFGQMLLYELNTRFSKLEPVIWGDPAGGKRDEIFEVTCFDHLRSLGLHAQPTVSNDFQIRREAGAAPMTRFVNGKPALQIDASCKQLRKSLGGGYHFKRVAMAAGQERFRDVPSKDMHSHIGDAFGYLCLGGGEHRRLTRGDRMFRDNSEPIVAPLDFNIF